MNDKRTETHACVCVDRRAAIDALDTAIKHYDEITEECRKKADIERNDYMDMRDDAYEARQLVLWLNELKYLREKIEQPTIEPERKRGKWIKVNGKTAINCSACYHCSWSLSFEDVVKRFDFCPNCGADMRGNEDER